jgi:hypothetical protein
MPVPAHLVAKTDGVDLDSLLSDWGWLVLNDLKPTLVTSIKTESRHEDDKPKSLWQLEFYRKHGYLETGRSFYGAVETVQFRKTLDEQVCEGAV